MIILSISRLSRRFYGLIMEEYSKEAVFDAIQKLKDAVQILEIASKEKIAEIAELRNDYSEKSDKYEKIKPTITELSSKVASVIDSLKKEV